MLLKSHEPYVEPLDSSHVYAVVGDIENTRPLDRFEDFLLAGCGLALIPSFESPNLEAGEWVRVGD